MKKKKWIVVLLGVVLIIVVCVGVRFIKGSSAEISLKENQRYVYAYITSIQGNEVTYMEMEESVVTAMLEPETETDKQTNEANDEKNENENSTEEFSNMPDMSSFPGGGEMPDMSNFPGGGEMPDMSNFPSGGQGGFGRNESSEKNEDSKESAERENNRMQFGSMSETVTTYIPVGVTVHTAADVSTTFSRLASGDMVKMLVEHNEAEDEIIEEIWMLQ